MTAGLRERQPGAVHASPAAARWGVLARSTLLPAVLIGSFLAFIGAFDSEAMPLVLRVPFMVVISFVATVLGFLTFQLTGRIPPPLIDPQAKVTALRRLSAERVIDLSATLAIGDGSNDIPMLKVAGLGIAFQGKPKVKQEIPVWIDHAGPTGLLYLQGYRRDEFVEG